MTTARISIGLVLATVLTYLPALWCDFVEWDDPAYVTENREVAAGLCPGSIAYAFTNLETANWTPVTWLSYELDSSLFGINPIAFHATNVVCHALNVWLLFLVLNRLTAATGRSAIVALFYAVHPLHVESVAWVSERKDVLSTFWLLATVLAYERYARQPGTRRLVATGLMMALGLLAKPMLVTLPVVLLLLDFWPLHRIAWTSGPLPSEPVRKYPPTPWRKVVWEKTPLFALSLIAGLVTLDAQRVAMSRESIMPARYRVANAIDACGWYLQKTVFPSGLCAFYPHPLRDLPWQRVGVTAALLLAFSFFVVACRRQRPWLLVGWLWFLVTLLPVLGLLQVGTQAHADRYVYVPHIGLFVLIVWGCHDRLAQFRAGPAYGLSLTIAGSAICIWLTLSQIRTWHDTRTLWSHALAVNPANYCALRGLGIIDLKQHDLVSAQRLLMEAVIANPYDGLTILSLGRLSRQRQEWDRAAQFYSWVLRINPHDADAARELGEISKELASLPSPEVVRENTGKVNPAAVECVRRGLKSARKQHARRADLKAALRDFEEAIRIDPAYAGAHVNAAIACRELGRRGDAIQHMQQALDREPDRMEHHADLAQLLELDGQRQAALLHYETALKLRPNDVETQIRQARLLRLVAER